jgi:hypothetical protein
MRILLLDIETAPNTAYVWGLYDQNISHEHLKETSYILCWSAKWSNEAAIQADSIQGSGPGTYRYKKMLRTIWTLLDQADIVVHYYGSKFDIPVLNREFAKYGLPPPSPYKQVDLKLVVAEAFRFESNKLAHVAEKLGLGSKMDTDFTLWLGCMEDNPKSWKYMKEYNKQDVVVLAQLYKKLLPWIKRHPSLSAFTGMFCCPKCGSTVRQKRGFQIAAQTAYQRYICLGCQAWYRSSIAIKRKGERGVNIT